MNEREVENFAEETVSALERVDSKLVDHDRRLEFATTAIQAQVTLNEQNRGRFTAVEDRLDATTERVGKLEEISTISLGVALILFAVGFFAAFLLLHTALGSLLVTVAASSNKSVVMSNRGWIEFLGAIFGGIAALGFAGIRFTRVPQNSSTGSRSMTTIRRVATREESSSTIVAPVVPEPQPAPVPAGTAGNASQGG